MPDHTPEPWYFVASLTEEECSRTGGMPAHIVKPGPIEVEIVAMDMTDADAEQATRCVNILAGTDSKKLDPILAGQSDATRYQALGLYLLSLADKTKQEAKT